MRRNKRVLVLSGQAQKASTRIWMDGGADVSYLGLTIANELVNTDVSRH